MGSEEQTSTRGVQARQTRHELPPWACLRLLAWITEML